MILQSSDFYPQSNPDSILEIQDPQQENSSSTSQGSTSPSVYSISTNKAVDIPANLQSYRILRVKTHVSGSALSDVMTLESKNNTFNCIYFDKGATSSTEKSKIAEITQTQTNLSKTLSMRQSTPPDNYLNDSPRSNPLLDGLGGGFQSQCKTETTQASSSISNLKFIPTDHKKLNNRYLSDPSISLFHQKITTPTIITTTTIPNYIPLNNSYSTNFQESKQYSALNKNNNQLQSFEVQIPSKIEQLSDSSFLQEDIRMCNLI